MKKIVLLAVLFFFSPCLALVEYQKISMDEAIEIAYKNNLDILAQKINIDIAQNEIKISNRLQNPSLESFWNFGASGRGNPNTIGISQNIELFKRGARTDYAKSNFELSKDEFEHAKFKLKMDVKEAYIKLLIAKAILKKYEYQQKFLENLLKISNKNNSDNTLDLDTIEAKIALNQMITEVNKIKTNEKIARIDFNRIINSSNGHYDTLDFEIGDNSNFIDIPQLEFPPYENIENYTLQKRYDLKIAQKQIELARKNLKNVTHQRIPNIEVSSGYGFQTRGVSEDGTYKAGAYLGANLVNLPILYSYKPEIKNAQLEIEKADLNYISTLNKARKSIEIAYERFLTAKINLSRYDDSIIKDSDKLFKLFEKTYSKENVDFATLAAIEESYSDFIRGYCEALNDYYISWIDFLREVNFEEFDFGAKNL